MPDISTFWGKFLRCWFWVAAVTSAFFLVVWAGDHLAAIWWVIPWGIRATSVGIVLTAMVGAIAAGIWDANEKYPSREWAWHTEDFILSRCTASNVKEDR